MKTPLVIYHGNCQDGFTAAWACWKAHPDWEFYPAKHGELPPFNTAGRDVYMLDFSYKRPVLEAMIMNETPKSITIICHHKTAEADLKDFDQPKACDPACIVDCRVIFDMNKSGARLAWEYFHGGNQATIPELVKLVEDRDLWRFAFTETKPISEYIFSKEYTFSNWDALDLELNIEATYQYALNAGRTILDKQKKDINELSANKFRIKIDGHEVWAVNVPYIYASDMAGMLAKEEPFAATFYYDGSTSKFIFSLRSTDDGLDVSEIAKKFGGGGHRNAAGFSLKGWPEYESVTGIQHFEYKGV